MKPTIKDKKLAHKIVQEAVKAGLLKRPLACSKCRRKGVIQGHHRDYFKPLEVEWLCLSCHLSAHGGTFGLRGPKNKKKKPELVFEPVPPFPLLITMAEACEIYGTNLAEIRRAIGEKKIRVYRIGGTIRLYLNSLPESI